MAKYYTGRIPSNKCGYSEYSCETESLPVYATIGNPDCSISSRHNYYRLARKIKGLVSDTTYYNLASVFTLLSGITETCDTSYDPNDDNGLFIDANTSFTTSIPGGNPIDASADCYSTETEYDTGAVDPIENIQSITLDNYPWANYWDFSTIPPILDSNTAPDVEMDCPFQVMEADGGGYYVAGSIKNVIQIMQNGVILETIVESSDAAVSGTGPEIYLKVEKDGDDFITSYVSEEEGGVDTYYYQIATISTDIENLVCSIITIETGSGYSGPFAITKSGATSYALAGGYVFAGAIGVSVGATGGSAGGSVYVKLRVVWNSSSGYSTYVSTSSSRITSQDTAGYEVMLGHITVSSSNIVKIEQYQYGDIFVAGRVV